MAGLVLVWAGGGGRLYKGYTLNAELHQRLYGNTDPGAKGLGVSGFVFVDYGSTRPFAPPGSAQGGR